MDYKELLEFINKISTYRIREIELNYFYEIDLIEEDYDGSNGGDDICSTYYSQDDEYIFDGSLEEFEKFNKDYDIDYELNYFLIIHNKIIIFEVRDNIENISYRKSDFDEDDVYTLGDLLEKLRWRIY